MSTILVTGGAGFIGSNFIRYWLDAYPDDMVLNYDALTYAGNLANVEPCTHSGRYRFIHGNIRNSELLHHIFVTYTPDYVVNFAAESHNSRALVHPDQFFETNVLGTQTLLQVALECAVPRIHHVSTCEVYGDLPLDSPEKFTEQSPYRPRTPYNASKAAGDLAVRAYFETFHLPVTISTCSNNYGAYQFPEKLIPSFTIKALKGQKMPLYQSSQNTREWLHVHDHCTAIDAILQHGVPGESYNIGSGIEADVETIAKLILSTLELDDSYKMYVNDRPGHDRRYLLDSGKIRRELHWEPQVVFEDGIRETIQWYVQHEAWWQPLLARLDINEETWK